MADSAAWRVADIDLGHQVHTLSAQETAELRAQLAVLQASGKAYMEAPAHAFELPTLDATLARLYDEVRDGAGFVMLRGLPVQAHTKDEVRAMAWMIASRFGRPVTQSAKGERIADVMDLIKGASSPRGYHSNAELRLHTDPASDVIGLCCIEAAKEGGDSMLASAVTAHDILQATRPDLLEVLYEGFPYARFGEGRPDDPEVSEYPVPVLSVTQGKVSCRYGSNRIRGACEASGRPLSAQQTEALAAFRDIAQENAVGFRMAPGDFLIVNNLTLLHARTNFVDNDDPEHPRHLLRFWLEAPAGFRPIVPQLNFFNRGRCGIVPRVAA
jgi:alpha-ketoglutarate-dependent taurine dioxygenase